MLETTRPPENKKQDLATLKAALLQYKLWSAFCLVSCFQCGCHFKWGFVFNTHRIQEQTEPHKHTGYQGCPAWTVNMCHTYTGTQTHWRTFFIKVCFPSHPSIYLFHLPVLAKMFVAPDAADGTPAGPAQKGRGKGGQYFPTWMKKGHFMRHECGPLIKNKKRWGDAGG